MATQAQDMEIPGRVIFLYGNGDLPKLEIDTPSSGAEIYLHGAQVTHFERKGEPPVLFLSQVSRFAKGQPIRGGIPIVFPWFGPREGEPMHGFARATSWELREIVKLHEGGIRLRLELPEVADAALLPKARAEYSVTVAGWLEAELKITNLADGQDFTFENCLHSYFRVGDIGAVSIAGLQGAAYLDKTENFARRIDEAGGIEVSGETDRVYFDTVAPVEIHDTGLGRRICIEKSGSHSTVVWNPWSVRAQQIPDLGNDEYRRMVCVESGNVGKNRVTLPPGASSSLKVRISTGPL